MIGDDKKGGQNHRRRAHWLRYLGFSSRVEAGGECSTARGGNGAAIGKVETYCESADEPVTGLFSCWATGTGPAGAVCKHPQVLFLTAPANATRRPQGLPEAIAFEPEQHAGAALLDSGPASSCRSLQHAGPEWLRHAHASTGVTTPLTATAAANASIRSL